MVKNPPANVGEKAMAPHSSVPAWKIPWTEEPGGLQSMGSLGVGHDWAASLSLFTFMHWRRKWQPTPVFLPGESQGRGSLVGAVYGVTHSRTLLKQLSSSSSQCRRLRRLRFDPCVRKNPWRRKWQPPPVFLPGESHGAWQATVHKVTKSQTQLKWLSKMKNRLPGWLIR